MVATTPFPYAAAQISVVRGDVAANLETHRRAIETAAAAGVGLLVFPELSLTGYELDLADSLQTTPDDPMFAPLQAFAVEHGMMIFIGAPLRAPEGKPYLGTVILGGDAPDFYAKIHVHESEAPTFQPGPGYKAEGHRGQSIGCAICADLNFPEHAAATRALGANVYALGALINEAAFAREAPLLEGYARDHGMAVVFANFASKSGAYTPIGKSSIWAPGGALVAQAEGTEQTLVIARQTADGWRGERVALA